MQMLQLLNRYGVGPAGRNVPQMQAPPPDQGGGGMDVLQNLGPMLAMLKSKMGGSEGMTGGSLGGGLADAGPPAPVAGPGGGSPMPQAIPAPPTPGLGQGMPGAPGSMPAGIFKMISDVPQVGPNLEKANGYMDGAMDAMGRPKPKVGGGIFDRIGGFLDSDEGRAALLRAGAAMLAGKNVGEGIMAGANMMDDRRVERQGNAFKERALANDEANTAGNNAYRAANVQNDVAQNVLNWEKMLREYMIKTGQLDLGHANLAETQRFHTIQDENTDASREQTGRIADQSNATTIRGQNISSADRRRGQNLGLLPDPKKVESYKILRDAKGKEIGRATVTKEAGRPVPIETQEDYDNLPSGTPYIDSFGIPGKKR